MSRSLIIGANSFLSMSLASLLKREQQAELFGLVNQSDNRVDYRLYKKVYNNFEALLADKLAIQTIFIVGAYIPYGTFDAPNQKFIESNIVLVAQICKSYPDARIVFCSSVSVYGNPCGSLNETSPFSNPGLYGLSKIAGEAIVRNQRSHIVVRFSSIWGAGMSKATYIPRIIEQAKEGKITLWGKGSRLQNYIHVEDAAKLLIAGSKIEENATVLGVYPKSYSNLAIAQLVARELSADITFENSDTSADFLFNASRSYHILGYVPQIKLENRIIELL